MSSTENHECPDSLDIKGENDFEELEGCEFDFYGVDNNCFKLDDVVYEAIEDEDDGLRSMLGCVEVSDAKGKIFFQTPVGRIVIEKVDDDGFDGYRLTDLHDGHCWLRFGTDNYDDYYPMFRFDYTPKSLEMQ